MKVEGFLSLYYETGFEGMHLALVQDTKFTTPNLSYLPDGSKGPKDYWDLAGAHNLKNGDHLLIRDSFDNILFDGTVTRNRKHENSDRLDFIPNEIEWVKWVTWLNSELRVTLTREDKNA